MIPFFPDVGNDHPPIYGYKVEMPSGPSDIIAIVPPEYASQHGLPPEGIIGSLLRPLREGEEITSDLFARNPVFVDFLHHVIAHHGPTQPACRAGAEKQGTGWLYLIDHRTPTPGGDVPPEDIIGAFEVVDGRIVPESYRGSERHRILSEQGFFQLDAGLAACLLEELENRREVE